MTTLQIIVPLVSDFIHLRVRIPIAQEWYAGRVPSTYVTTGPTPALTTPIGPGGTGPTSTQVTR